ncbi:MAG: hypothetical protein K9L17_10120 [Clostridiales bacterium]|nr:hypothetical protein [Clostridiales bacterium]MCF8023036.1 hypothetical protein [Clostridiales bacterium]
MINTLYTATGCTRCKIVKRFMEERDIPYTEKDMKAEGKEEFQQFYKANRKYIYRGENGIEFPVFTNGEAIYQGIGPAVAYLHFNGKLDEFFSIGVLHKEWVDGIYVSHGNPEYAGEFIEVLRFLKNNNLKLQVDTNGKNNHILRQILDEGLADIVIMNVLGPEELYSKILGEDINIDEVKKSIETAAKFPEVHFQTTVVPVVRQEGDSPEISYLAPEEVAEAAKLIEEVTESKKNPYLIKLFKTKEAKDKRLKAVGPLSAANLMPYRSKARAYQVFTEVEKA